jgi:hypothetical protein
MYYLLFIYLATCTCHPHEKKVFGASGQILIFSFLSKAAQDGVVRFFAAWLYRFLMENPELRNKNVSLVKNPLLPK